MKQFYQYILFLVCLLSTVYGQGDVLIGSMITPSNSCELSATEPIQVQFVNNTSPNILIGIEVKVRYRVNNGPWVEENLESAIGGISGSYNYEFVSRADLSAFQTYSIEVEAYYNLSATQPPVVESKTFSVSHYDPSYAGILTGPSHVCKNNNNSIVEANDVFGDILKWQVSTDSTSWSDLNVTSNSISIQPSGDSLFYRVIAQNESCTPDTSIAYKVMFDTESIGGVISTDTTVCMDNNSGSISISGQNGNITNWENSTDLNNWQPIGATSNPISFAELNTNTYYRAIVENGTCPPVFSDTMLVSVDSVSIGGNVIGDSSMCVDDIAGFVRLTNYRGNINYWVYSDVNQQEWDTVFTTSSTLDYDFITDTTVFMAIVTNGVCSPSNSSLSTINIKPLPFVDAGFDETIELGETFVLNGMSEGVYVWSPDFMISDTSVLDPEVYPDTTTTYFLTATLEGCSDLDSVIISVNKDLTEFEFISNTITPNGDGKNDVWYIEGIEYYEGNKVYVFDVNGQIVFEASDYRNDWEGTYNGSTLQNGTYFYIIECPSLTEPAKGFISILKN